MKKLDEILAGKKSVGLAGHVRPDGDCVGSTLGVYNYIRKYIRMWMCDCILSRFPISLNS